MLVDLELGWELDLRRNFRVFIVVVWTRPVGELTLATNSTAATCLVLLLFRCEWRVVGTTATDKALPINSPVESLHII